MTVDGTNNRTDYDPDGATTTFIYDFRVDVASDMAVFADGLIYANPRTITGLGNELGGDVIFDVAPVASIETLTLIREVPLTQQTSYPPLGPFPAGSHEAALDKLTFIDQQLQEQIDRQALAPIDADPATSYIMPKYAAGEYWAWGEDTKDIVTKIISISADTSLIVANIPSLRGVVGTYQGQPADVLGFAVPGDDAGGPTRIWNEGAGQIDTGGDVIVPGGTVGSVSTVGAWVFTPDENTVVEFYGALGDGITDDKTAFYNMFNATGGSIRFRDKAYNINGLILEATTVSIQGVTQPARNLTNVKLEGGSILVGTLTVRCTKGTAANFGVDTGSDRGLPIGTEGFVFDAKVGELGSKVDLRNLTILGPSVTSVTHALLVEGFNHNNIDNIDVALRTFGVVVKGRNAHVTNITSYEMAASSVFIKSDTPAIGGNVLDATVQEVIVDGVVSNALVGNTDLIHVYVQASTEPLSTVIVNNVVTVFGQIGVRVGGGAGTELASGIIVSNIITVGGTVGVDLFGQTFETTFSNIQATNPSSGKAFITGGSSVGWQFNNVSLLISDPAITGSIYADMVGTGVWNNLSVRNPYREMTLDYDPVSVRGGVLGDGITVIGEGPVPMSANWAGQVLTREPLTVRRIPGDDTCILAGSMFPNAGATSIAAVLPIKFRPALSTYVPCIVTSAGGIGYAVIYPSGNVQIGGFAVGQEVYINITIKRIP